MHFAQINFITHFKKFEFRSLRQSGLLKYTIQFVLHKKKDGLRVKLVLNKPILNTFY